ncbi:MAG: 50S ribosomal protein L13 [Pirellulaceae bacterium]|nr:50S ribosomal protein L13 [Pirellulaceae bacterium]
MAGTKTYVAKHGEHQADWWLVDAQDAIVGRLASQLAMILMGKHRPGYTPHVDTGDYVVVLNVDKLRFTGKKMDQKSYARYSGYPGGYYTDSVKELAQDNPEKILREAVRRMLPKNKLARHMLAKLKCYRGTEHPHQAQNPRPLEAAGK